MARQNPTPDTPWYEVTEKVHYINGQLYSPGAKVQYTGRPGKFLIPVAAADVPAIVAAVEAVPEPPPQTTRGQGSKKARDGRSAAPAQDTAADEVI